MSVVYGDVEQVVKAWLRATPAVADLVPLPGGAGPAIFNAMPTSAPNPVILAELVAGGPSPREDLPCADYRITFDVYGRTRAEAAGVTYALVGVLESLARDGSWDDGTTTVYAANVVLMRWFPDPDSDTPRYIVDALITTVT